MDSSEDDIECVSESVSLGDKVSLTAELNHRDHVALLALHQTNQTLSGISVGSFFSECQALFPE